MKPITLTEFSIYMAQRPGELAGLLDASLAAGVDITSVSTTEHMDRGCVRLLGEPEEKLRHVCESLVESGVGPVVEAPVIAVSIENRPGAVRDIVMLMADNRINVRYCYLAPSSNGSAARAIFRIDELERALEIIEQTDWPASGESAA